MNTSTSTAAAPAPALGKYHDDNVVHCFDAHQMRVLERVRLRLYAPAPLTGDERRDLANTLDAVMHGALATHL